MTCFYDVHISASCHSHSPLFHPSNLITFSEYQLTLRPQLLCSCRGTSIETVACSTRALSTACSMSSSSQQSLWLGRPIVRALCLSQQSPVLSSELCLSICLSLSASVLTRSGAALFDTKSWPSPLHLSDARTQLCYFQLSKSGQKVEQTLFEEA